MNKPCKPVKSPSGATLALVSRDGLELWDKRTRAWQTFSMERLQQLHAEVQQGMQEPLKAPLQG